MPAHVLQRRPHTSGDRSLPPAGLWKRLREFLSRRAGIGADRFGMRLRAGQELRLQDATGWTIACRSGSVWITQEADTRDTFLDSGERFTLDRGGLALVLARQDSALAIRSPAGGASRETETPDNRKETDVNAHRDQGHTSTIHGNLLRLSAKRSVAIYLRDGVAAVAEFEGARCRILSVGEWHAFHARKLAHAQRRGEVEIVSPIPEEVVARIEREYRRLAEPPYHRIQCKPGALLPELA